MNDEILTQEETAEMLGVSRTTMHRMLKSGQLKGLKAGGQWRFRRADVLAHLERGPQPLSPLALEGIDAELEFFANLNTGERASFLEAREAQSEADAKLSTLANALLSVALQSHASDLHLEPTREGIQLRRRSDGVLHLMRTLPTKLGEALVVRLKTLGAMDESLTQLPQDGRAIVKYQDRAFNIHFSTIPTLHGEALTLSIVMRRAGFSELEKMDLSDEQKAELLTWMRRPYGLVVACGPTGSGKDSLVYGLLSEVVTGESKIVSIEDPVDFDVPGVMQVSCNRRTGFTPAKAARALMRLDPDVVMIARLDEAETAETALLLASDGHLVLVGLDVSSIKGVVAQMLDFGIDLMALESLLLGVVSMRLLRRVCPDCAETIEIPHTTEAALRAAATTVGFEVPSHVEWKQGRGCDKCRHSGYLGRRAIYELTKWNENLTQFTRQGVDEPSLEEVAQDGGNVLKAEGVRLAVEGITSPHEVLRVLFARAF